MIASSSILQGQPAGHGDAEAAGEFGIGGILGVGDDWFMEFFLKTCCERNVWMVEWFICF